MKPLLKWVGGKRRFLKKIDDAMEKHDLKKFNDYYEPFFGSGALMFHLQPKNKIHINDLNNNLINFYKSVQNDHLALRKEIIKLMNSRKDDFYEVRTEYNELIKKQTKNYSTKEAAYFFYLNKMGFNGMYRVNSSGGYNVPQGQPTSGGPYIPSVEEFEEAHSLLSSKKTIILSGSWEKAIENAGDGDLIYFDPPYFPDISSKFLGYTNPVFDEGCHEEMVKASKEKVDNGAAVLISNSAAEGFKDIIEKYFGKEYDFMEIKTKRSINPTVEDKDKFVEMLYILGGKNVN